MVSCVCIGKNNILVVVRYSGFLGRDIGNSRCANGHFFWMCWKGLAIAYEQRASHIVNTTLGTLDLGEDGIRICES